MQRCQRHHLSGVLSTKNNRLETNPSAQPRAGVRVTVAPSAGSGPGIRFNSILANTGLGIMRHLTSDSGTISSRR